MKKTGAIVPSLFFCPGVVERLHKSEVKFKKRRGSEAKRSEVFQSWQTNHPDYVLFADCLCPFLIFLSQKYIVSLKGVAYNHFNKLLFKTLVISKVNNIGQADNSQHHLIFPFS